MARWLKAAANLVGGTLFLALFLVFLVQIGARFGLNKPLPWTDEAAVILYVWIILWAAATMVPRKEHVVFDLLWNMAGHRAPSQLGLCAIHGPRRHACSQHTLHGRLSAFRTAIGHAGGA
jgi:TRAP-type C4-dicarboxylate transport system permease small subunit